MVEGDFHMSRWIRHLLVANRIWGGIVRIGMYPLMIISLCIRCVGCTIAMIRIIICGWGRSNGHRFSVMFHLGGGRLIFHGMTGLLWGIWCKVCFFKEFDVVELAGTTAPDDEHARPDETCNANKTDYCKGPSDSTCIREETALY